MASFKVIAGDFGQGSGQVLVGRPYRPSAQGFEMPKPGHSFQTEHIPTGQIETLEIATEEGLKKIAGSVGWGIAGGLALGPFGALAGVLSGGRKTQITFGSSVAQFLKDGKALGKVQVASVVTMYIAGSHLPASSPCLNGKLDTCFAEFTALTKDKSQIVSISNEMTQMTASLSSR